MDMNEIIKKENPEFYEASNKLERKEEEIIQALEERKRLAMSGRFKYNRVRKLRPLIKEFLVLVKQVNQLVKEARENV